MSLHLLSRQELQNALAHFKAGRQTQALAACQNVSPDDPAYPEALHLNGVIAFRAGDAALAAALIGRAVELKPGYREALANLGHALRKLGRLPEATAAYRDAARVDPANASIQNSLGVALLEQGHLDDAIAAFRAATTLRPDHVEALNRLGGALRQKGELDAAIAAFARLVALQPDRAEPHNNLGVALAEAGRSTEAIEAFQRALAIDPRQSEAHVGLGTIFRQQYRLDDAMQAFRRAVAIDPALADVHMAIYAIAQALGDKATAIAHQRQALQVKRVFSEWSGTATAARNILILNAPGDWQANIPTDFLFDKTRNNLHTYYICDDASGAAGNAALPPCDIIFNAIAEPDAVRPNLLLAERFIGAMRKPSLNDPRRVIETTRDHMAAMLQGIEHCLIPRVRRATRHDLSAPSLDRFLAASGAALPILIRPAGAHAGNDLAKIDNRDQVAGYLADVAADEFYVTDFVDYSNGDSHYRKYRFIYIGGVPYPFHLAVSKRWMVHYYNADMDSAWKRDEECRFLADYTQRFDASLQRALETIGKAVGLDYFGIDCSITADNRLLLFEVDVGMIVHLMDPIATHPCKHRYVPRIFQALERLIDARIAGMA